MAIFTKELNQEASRLRALFSNEAVKEIVFEHGLFDTINKEDPGWEGKLALRNKALELLYRMGMMTDELISKAIDEWYKMDYTVEDKENDNA